MGLFVSIFSFIVGVSNLSLQSPQAYEVFQRNIKNQARIRVKGGFTEPQGSGVEICFLFKEKIVASEVLTSNLIAFEKDFVDLPAVEGWYRLVVRSRLNADTCLAPSASEGTLVVDHIGVGEVFLTAGEANSANHGDAIIQSKNDLISTANLWVNYGIAWRYAKPPFTVATGSGGSVWIPFLEKLSAKLKVPIALIAIGREKSRIDQWLPLTPALESQPAVVTAPASILEGKKPVYLFESRMRMALSKLLSRHLAQGGEENEPFLRAILWHQGETDNNYNTDAAKYKAALKQIISEVAATAKYSPDWFIANATFNCANGFEKAISSAQIEIVSENPELHLHRGPISEVLIDTQNASDRKKAFRMCQLRDSRGTSDGFSSNFTQRGLVAVAGCWLGSLYSVFGPSVWNPLENAQDRTDFINSELVPGTADCLPD